MARSTTRILYTILDWGLGHATRSIPVIQALLEAGAEVIVAGEGRSAILLQHTFPNLTHVRLQGLQINYPNHLPMHLHIAVRIPELLHSIKKEHEETESLVTKFRPDAIISDNRYGAWSDRIPSVFMGHQLDIQLPASLKILSPFLFRTNKRLLSRFNHIWVPDLPGEENLSGKLSHGEQIEKAFHPTYIGLLSRFRECEIADIHERYELLAVLSGPEPQRSLLEKNCIEHCRKLGLKALIVQGLPGNHSEQTIGQVKLVNHLDSAPLKAHLCAAKTILMRSGYSSLMDLVALGKTAICIPTPGQTEQEYLAKYLSEKETIVYRHQNRLDLENAIDVLSTCKPLPFDTGNLLEENVNIFLKSLVVS